MASLLQRFRAGLKRSTSGLTQAFGVLFARGKLDPKALEDLEEALYGADFGAETAEAILAEISEAARKNKELRGEEASAIATRVLTDTLEGAEGRLDWAHSPEVIALVGINGSGKTTTAAKLGYHFGQAGKKATLGACDTFRAAANEQILAWSERLGLDLVTSHAGADSAAVAFDAYQAAKRRKSAALVLDTAGRLHTKGNLMQELAKLRRVLQKHDREAPHHAWLVVDGSLGSNSIEQARVFHREFGLTGLVVTKLDGTSRGGALVAIYRELKLPVYFVGLGEQPEDLQPFSVENYVQALLGQEVPA